MIFLVAGAGLSAVNRCAFVVWPAYQGPSDEALNATGVSGLKPNKSVSWTVPDSWNGQIWGRTGCSGSVCQTGGSSAGATLAEITFGAATNLTYYDVSVISGFNLPLSLSPSPQLGCKEATCLADINALKRSGNTTTTLEKLCPNAFVSATGPDRTFACSQTEFMVSFCSAYISLAAASEHATAGPSPSSPSSSSPVIQGPTQPPSTDRGTQLGPYPSSPSRSNKSHSTGLPLIVGGCSGIFVIVGVVVGCSIWMCRSRWKHGKPKIPGIAPRKFKYKELYSATKGFNPSELLGAGGHGLVYKGILVDTGLPVAVKKVPAGKEGRGIQELASEMHIISKLHHRNLLQLQGWCEKKGELLVVYDYMPNGSLDKALFANDCFVLDWRTRYKIVCGLGKALLYLHDEGEKRVVHRDVKPSNIMLDVDFEAKLGDFGLARLVDHDVTPRTTDVAGTIGYVAPELTRTRRPTAESDVYSFGIVALEVACGRQSFVLAWESGSFLLLDKVRNLAKQGRLLEAADSRLAGSFDVDQLERLLSVGLAATNSDPHGRPTMKQILTILTREAPISLNIEEEE